MQKYNILSKEPEKRSVVTYKNLLTSPSASLKIPK